MQEVAQATFTYEQFPEVMGMLWKRMLGERKNWRRTYKVGLNKMQQFKLSVTSFPIIVIAAVELSDQKWF